MEPPDQSLVQKSMAAGICKYNFIFDCLIDMPNSLTTEECCACFDLIKNANQVISFITYYAGGLHPGFKLDGMSPPYRGLATKTALRTME